MDYLTLLLLSNQSVITHFALDIQSFGVSIPINKQSCN